MNFHYRFSLPVLLACFALPVLGQAPGGPTPIEVLNGSAQFAGAVNPSLMLRVVLGLQPPHWAEEQQFLSELHTQGSPNFLQFLTPEEWNARFSPSIQDEQSVVDWATSQGLTVAHRYPNRLTVSLAGSMAVIGKAFGVQINNYQLGTTTFFSNDRDPVLPSNLATIVQSVIGLNSLQVLHPANQGMPEPVFPIYSPDVPDGQATEEGFLDATAKPPAAETGGDAGPSITGGAYDPTDIYSSQAYDLNALSAQGHCCNPLGNANGSPAQSSIAIATAGSQLTTDFQGFQHQYPYLAMHWSFIDVDGTPTCCDGEGTMDFEWSTSWSNSFGAATSTASIYMYDGANAQLSTFTDVYQRILNDGKARVFSTSWGGEEIYGDPTSVMNTDDAIFANLVGTGWTVVAASGDSARPRAAATGSRWFPGIRSERSWRAGRQECRRAPHRGHRPGGVQARAGEDLRRDTLGGQRRRSTGPCRRPHPGADGRCLCNHHRCCRRRLCGRGAESGR